MNAEKSKSTTTKPATQNAGKKAKAMEPPQRHSSAQRRTVATDEEKREQEARARHKHRHHHHHGHDEHHDHSNK